MTRPILYHAMLDLDCFAVRLLLGVLALDYEAVAIDVFPGIDTLSRDFLASGPVPAISVGGATSHGLDAVLAVIGRQFDVEGRWVTDCRLHIRMAELDVVSDCRNRSMTGDGEADVEAARQALLALEDELTCRHLLGQDWIGDDRPTALDLVLYSRVALMRDFGLEPGEFPALRAWLRGVRMLAPGVAMPGILDPI
jgi:glutathione S-transferase